MLQEETRNAEQVERDKIQTERERIELEGYKKRDPLEVDLTKVALHGELQQTLRRNLETLVSVKKIYSSSSVEINGAVDTQVLKFVSALSVYSDPTSP